jgi:hypothetical protein
MSNQTIVLPVNADVVVGMVAATPQDGDSFSQLRQWMFPVGNPLGHTFQGWEQMHPEWMPYFGAQ